MLTPASTIELIQVAPITASNDVTLQFSYRTFRSLTGFNLTIVYINSEGQYEQIVNNSSVVSDGTFQTVNFLVPGVTAIMSVSLQLVGTNVLPGEFVYSVLLIWNVQGATITVPLRALPAQVSSVTQVLSPFVLAHDLATFYPRSIVLAGPAAGANFTFSVPGVAQWRIRSIIASFSTSAVAATRHVFFQVNVSGIQHFRVYAPLTQTALQNRVYSMMVNIRDSTAVETGGFVNMQLPELTLYPGWSCIVGAVAIDAGDQFSLINLIVDEALIL